MSLSPMAAALRLSYCSELFPHPIILHAVIRLQAASQSYILADSGDSDGQRGTLTPQPLLVMPV